MKNIDLLRNLCKTPGAPGYESRIRSLIISEITPLVDEIRVDAMGNVIALRKGKNRQTVAVAAHMDEISFIVTHIDDDGFIRFHTLGGFDAKTLTAQRVIIHGKEDVVGVMGTKPIHSMTPEERNKPVKTTDFFIDTGRDSAEVKQLISIGDVITRERELEVLGNCINAKSLDNRISCYILIEAMRDLVGKQLPFDVCAVFTVQEEVGLRGAMTAFSGLNPEFGIALDVTIAYDLPGAQGQEMITKLGKGTAIKVMDGMTICDYRMVDFMKQVANKNDIPYQLEILPAGGTDTAGIQRGTNGGSIAGAISIPTRYLHQVIEMVHQNDVSDTISLLTSCLLAIDTYDWSHR